MKKRKTGSARSLITAADRPLFSWAEPEFRPTPPPERERRGARKVCIECPGTKMVIENGEYVQTAPSHTIAYDNDDVTIVRSKFAVERCVYCPTCRHDVVISHTPTR
jgi:hypothetical protein